MSIARTVKESLPALDPKLKEMQDMVEKYGKTFPIHQPSMDTPREEVVLLTGSTGRLGSYLIASLLADPNIKHIYALNRKDSRGSHSLLERQAIAFEDKSLDKQLIYSSRLTLVEGDASIPDLGLTSNMYELLRQKVTCIIHNAWTMGFMSSLKKMEPMIKQSRNLIDFSLRSPHTVTPRFVFVSSEGVAKNWNKVTPGPVPEIHLDDPALACGSGYSESKWVTENVLTRAAEHTPLKPLIMRVGQLSAGPNGEWTPTEWFPLLLQFSQAMGYLPIFEGAFSWLPPNIAADTIVEMRNSAESILHIVHPDPMPCQRLFLHLSRALKIPIVKWADWLGRLQAPSDPNLAMFAGPAQRIIAKFETNIPSIADPVAIFKFPTLSTSQAFRGSQALRQVAQISASDIECWVSHWRKTGFLNEVRAAKL